MSSARMKFNCFTLSTTLIQRNSYKRFLLCLIRLHKFINLNATDRWWVWKPAILTFIWLFTNHPISEYKHDSYRAHRGDRHDRNHRIVYVPTIRTRNTWLAECKSAKHWTKLVWEELKKNTGQQHNYRFAVECLAPFRARRHATHSPLINIQPPLYQH